METLTQSKTQALQHIFPLNGPDHLGFCAGNFWQSVLYGQAAFGCEWQGFRGHFQPMVNG